MQFHNLRVDVEPFVLGVRDGVAQALLDRSGFRDVEEFARISKLLGSVDYWRHAKDIDRHEFDVQCMRLLPKAKRTDFTLFSPHLMMCPFLISEAVKKVLGRFKLHGVKLWNANVMHQSGAYSYSLMHITRLPDTVIDFSTSTFSVSGNAAGRRSVAFQDVEEKALCEQSNEVDFESIYFNDSFDSTLDFFKLSNADIVVSDRLKAAIEANKFTAVQFHPAIVLKGGAASP
jgi:hypothetical protein